MFKKFTILFSLALFCFSIQAQQLPNGALAPDFTVTDLDGTEHTLSDYLDEGKTVIVDLSTAWCAPCWTFHQTGILETIWQEHGPNGDNTIQVLWIESQSTNTLEQIQGVTTSQDAAGFSQGDWTQGVTFPLVDDATVAAAFSLQNIPAVYVIRPNGRAYNAFTNFSIYPTVERLEYYALNDLENDVALIENNSGVFFCDETVVETEDTVTVANMGTADLTSFTIEVLQDDQVIHTMDWTGSMVPLESIDLVIPNSMLTLMEATQFEYRVSNPNGVEDMSDLLNNDLVAFPVLSSRSSITFSIRTDFWPEEIGWEFRAPDGSVVFSSAEFDPLECDMVYTQTRDLPMDGCYELQLSDDFGDGLVNGAVTDGSHSCNTQNGMENMAMGEIALISNEGDTLFNNINYGSGGVLPVEGEAASAIDQVRSLGDVNLFPNPASETINLDFELSEATFMKVSLINNLGQEVRNVEENIFLAGENRLSFDVSDLAKGVYFITFTGENGVSTERFTINR